MRFSNKGLHFASRLARFRCPSLCSLGSESDPSEFSPPAVLRSLGEIIRLSGRELRMSLVMMQVSQVSRSRLLECISCLLKGVST